ALRPGAPRHRRDPVLPRLRGRAPARDRASARVPPDRDGDRRRARGRGGNPDRPGAGPGLDQRAGALARERGRVLGGVGRLPRAPRPPRQRELRLPRLGDPDRRPVRARRSLPVAAVAAGGRARPRRGDPDAARARHEHAALPARARRRPRPPVPARAEADVAGYARWTWTTAGLVRREARAVLVGAIALVAVAADLHVHALRATAADQGNRAYAALQGGPRDARLLELPVFLPDVHYGSVYQYYDTGARRE